MKDFISKHPYLFAVGVFIIDNLLAIPFVLAFKILELDLEPLRLIIPVAQSIVVIAALYYLGWLRAAGFGNKVKNIHVLWFPFVLAFVPVFMFGTIELGAYPIIFYGLALLFTGISEEGVARGIILKALLPKGKWAALLFMAILFSVGHFTNLFFEDFNAIEMIEKLLTTFSFALLYGAIFLRTLNIWPLIALHTIHDFSFLTSGTAGPYSVVPLPTSIHILLAVISIAYAVYILRNVDAGAVLKETERATI